MFGASLLSVLLVPFGVGPIDTPILRTPDVFGDSITFSCEGNLWLGDLRTGKASRLTRDSGRELHPRFSPDGKQIAFTAQYDGAQEIYVMPTSGGVPVRSSWRNDYAICAGWTWDGKCVVYKGRNVPRSYAIYTTPVGGGREEKLPLEFAAHADLDSAKGFVFTRFNREEDAWFHYGGGKQNQIWLGAPSGRSFHQLTNLPGTCECPCWVGDRICFVQELNGKFTVFSMDARGADRKVVAGPYPVEVKELHGNGNRLVYEKGTGVEVADLAAGTVAPVFFNLASDRIHERPFETDPARFVQSRSISPSGKRVLVETRGQIVSVPAKEGESRVLLGVSGVRFRLPKMSPDGARIAYLSDESGKQEVYVAKSDGTEPKQITHEALKRAITGIQWSPDSKWLVISDSRQRMRLVDVSSGAERLLCTYGNGWASYRCSFSPDSKWVAYVKTTGVTEQTQIAIYGIEKSDEHVLGVPFSYDSLPTFSSDGKYLVFASHVSFSVIGDPFLNQLNSLPGLKVGLLLLKASTPDPFAPSSDEESGKVDPVKKEDSKAFAGIDFERLYQRRVILPLPAATWTELAMSGSRVVAANEAGQIRSFDIESKKEGAVTTGSSFEVSADGKKLLVGDRVLDFTAENVGAEVGKVGFGGLKLQVDPKAEWKGMFWDAWRQLRDWFYVENMNGVNWEQIGKKYEAMLPQVRSRWELDQLIKWMQSELNCSHMYLSPGDDRTAPAAHNGAFLGIDTAADASGFLRISRIYRGDGLVPAEQSPLASPSASVKEGSFLLEVAGKPLTSASDYRAALDGRAGQVVSILVNDTPTLTGAKRLYVKPIADEFALRRLDWVESCRQYVDRASGGKIGYIHLWAMTDSDMSGFIRQFYPQRTKDALIVDVRFNNGGYTQVFFNRILSEKLTGFFNQRNSPFSWSRQSDYFLGPMACVMNEFNISCGEEFPHRFRDLKIGPLIGRRTTGGEVGSSPGWSLADGGVVNIPNYGMWTPKDGWVIEAHGVDPDIDVPSNPNAYVTGHDLQLDKSIEYLLAELKAHPVIRPKQPADPIRVRG